MPRRMPGAIKQRFSEYRQFLSDGKMLEHNKIQATIGGPKKNFIGRTSVIYHKLDGEKSFEVEISVIDRSHYHFRLYAYCFDVGPCLRFDSKGRSHCNPESGQGLRKRQVLTPHFHKFDEKESMEIAYKTVKLRELERNLSIKDYMKGLEHFCQEARLNCNNSVHPAFDIEQEQLDLSSDDPQNGVNFI